MNCSDGTEIEIVGGVDGGAEFLLNHAPYNPSHTHSGPKKYLLKTGSHSHSWVDGDGNIHGTLTLIPV